MSYFCFLSHRRTLMCVSDSTTSVKLGVTPPLINTSGLHRLPTWTPLPLSQGSYVFLHTWLCVCGVRVLGNRAPGNMQGNKLEHAEQRPSLFRCGELLGMAAEHIGTDTHVGTRGI